MKLQVWRRTALAAVIAMGWTQAMPSSAHDWTFMRFPALHGGMIVFEAQGNLWQVGRGGGETAHLPFRRGRERAPPLGPRQYGGHLDAGFEEHRLSFPAHGVEQLVWASVRSAGGRPRCSAIAARSWRPHDLEPRRQVDRVQPHLQQFPDLEAL